MTLSCFVLIRVVSWQRDVAAGGCKVAFGLAAGLLDRLPALNKHELEAGMKLCCFALPT